MPFQPKFHITPHLLKIIEEISAFREKILAASVQVSWIPALQKETRVRNTHSSTAIEGNPLSLDQVRALEEGKSVPTATERAKAEIVNYLNGLKFIEKNQKKKKITHQDILKLHTIVATKVMDQGKSGRYRAMLVRVGSYIAPHPEQVHRLMTDLLEWWNQKAPEWSPVISSAILHHQFETIHPFADGNGRVGRTLALWELYRRGFDSHHIFSVDEVYWEGRPQYYQALAAVRREKGDLTSWLEYTAEALHLTLERVWMRVEHLSAKKGDVPIVLTPKQEELLRMLRDRKSLTPKEIWEGLGISKQAVHKLLKPLLDAELVGRIGTRKLGKYILV